MMEFVKEYWEVVGWIIQLALGWLLWSMRRAFVTKEDLAAAVKTSGDATDALDTRLAEAETTLRLHGQSLDSLPTDGDLHEISQKMADVHRQSSVTAATVDGISQQLKSIATQVTSLNNYLLTRGGK